MHKYIFLLTIILLPFVSFAQGDAQKKSAYFFYLNSCSHCHNVDDYFTANGIYEKYDIKKLDASIPQNGEFLMKLYEANGYPENQRGGVPVVVFGDKFFVGDKPVIDNFVKEIEAIENTQVSNVPADIVVHDGPLSKISEPASVPQSGTLADKGNKKNYFPVIIAVLVVVGAGALILANRKS